MAHIVADFCQKKEIPSANANNFAHTSTQCEGVDVSDRAHLGRQAMHSQQVLRWLATRLRPKFGLFSNISVTFPPANAKQAFVALDPMAKLYGQVKMKPGYNNRECHIYFGLAG